MWALFVGVFLKQVMGQDISGNLPQLAINSVYEIKGYGNSVVFVVTDGGVCHTKNRRENWERTGTNMLVFPVYDDTNHVLVVGTFIRSIMTIDLAEIVEKYYYEPDTTDAINDEMLISKFYPNQADTYFEFSTSKILHNAKLTISDVNGKQISTKSIKNNNHLQVNNQQLKIGIYFVRVFENN